MIEGMTRKEAFYNAWQATFVFVLQFNFTITVKKKKKNGVEG